jgi:RNA recognition motif-containing protein
MSELDRKVFVGGLSPRTNSESLGSAFGKYGKILESNVIMDKLSGNSKGYGFVCQK